MWLIHHAPASNGRSSHRRCTEHVVRLCRKATPGARPRARTPTQPPLAAMQCWRSMCGAGSSTAPLYAPATCVMLLSELLSLLHTHPSLSRGLQGHCLACSTVCCLHTRCQQYCPASPALSATQSAPEQAPRQVTCPYDLLQ